MKTLNDVLASYRNDEATNDHFWKRFLELSYSVDFISNHRDYTEKYKLGFGDRAFHYMWYLIINHLSRTKEIVDCLEIGIYKGQILSLWGLIAKEIGLQINLTGISPLEGNFRKTNYFIFNLMKLNPKFRKTIKQGNHYEYDDYYNIIKKLFEHFELDFDKLNLLKGFSNDPKILDKLSDKKYDIIYIDGDHSYEGVIADLKNYVPKLKPDGFLVMDDASFFLPGTLFWKGHEEVSKAAEIIPELGMKNILNIGHNRVFVRI